MGVIMSAQKSIDSLRFTELKKGRPVPVVQAMSLGNGSVILKLEDGQFSVVGGRHHSPNGNYAVMGYGTDEPTQAVLNGLAKMGVITRDDVRSHVKRVKEREFNRSREYAIKRLRKACEDLGIDPPKVDDK